jgi:undecaprenyl-diphosphatase
VFDIAIRPFCCDFGVLAKKSAALFALPNEKQAQRFALNVLWLFYTGCGVGVAVLAKGHQGTLFTPVVVANAFIVRRLHHFVGGAAKRNGIRIHNVESMTTMDALKVGLVQCRSPRSRTSRSSSTIIGGMLPVAQGSN